MTRMSARRRIARIGVRAVLGAVVSVAVLLLIFFLALRPPGESFDPVPWAPEPGFMVSEEVTDPRVSALVSAFSDATIQGPEDLAVDEQGRLYTGTQDGVIVRILASGETEIFADVGGRPLGLVFDHDGSLLVANHGLGLQRVAPDGEVQVLTDAANGDPILSANDVAVARDGTVYLSDSNPRYNSTTLPGLASYSLYDFLEGRADGRVIAYDPSTGLSSEVVTDLYFPNGILLDQSGTSLLITESTRFRITRYWVSGPEAGAREPFLENVPGILDGITRDDSGQIYLSMYDRVDALERFVLPSRFARQFMVRIPPALIAAREPLSGSILMIDDRATVIRHLTGFNPAVSNVALLEDALLLGTLEGDSVRIAPH